MRSDTSTPGTQLFLLALSSRPRVGLWTQLSMPFRPAFLARYRARSAWASSSAALMARVCVAVATPTLSVTESLRSEPFGASHRVVRTGPREDRDELVAAVATDHIAFATKAGFGHFRDRSQQPVTVQVTVAVVVFLERVEIEEHQGERLTGATRAPPGRIEHDREIAPVDQAGERVDRSVIDELGPQLLVAPIVDRDHRSDDRRREREKEEGRRESLVSALEGGPLDADPVKEPEPEQPPDRAGRGDPRSTNAQEGRRDRTDDRGEHQHWRVEASGQESRGEHHEDRDRGEQSRRQSLCRRPLRQQRQPDGEYAERHHDQQRARRLRRHHPPHPVAQEREPSQEPGDPLDVHRTPK